MPGLCTALVLLIWVDRVFNTQRREAFAQAFAVFFSNPDLLKQNAPKVYAFIDNLNKNPLRDLMQLKKDSKFVGPNVKKYQEVFGHQPSPEAWKYKTPEEVDQIAEMAVKRGKPEPTWANRGKNLNGSISDQYYQ